MYINKKTGKIKKISDKIMYKIKNRSNYIKMWINSISNNKKIKDNLKNSQIFRKHIICIIWLVIIRFS